MGLLDAAALVAATASPVVVVTVGPMAWRRYIDRRLADFAHRRHTQALHAAGTSQEADHDEAPGVTALALTPARRRSLLVLLAEHWAPNGGVRASNATSHMVDGEPVPNAWGELCASAVPLVWLRDHGCAHHRPGSDNHYVLTDAGLELALTLTGQEQARP